MHLIHETKLTSLFQDVVCTQIHPQGQGGVSAATNLTQKKPQFRLKPFPFPAVALLCVHMANPSFCSIALQPNPLSFAVLGQSHRIPEAQNSWGWTGPLKII